MSHQPFDRESVSHWQIHVTSLPWIKEDSNLPLKTPMTRVISITVRAKPLSSQKRTKIDNPTGCSPWVHCSGSIKYTLWFLQGVYLSLCFFSHHCLYIAFPVFAIVRLVNRLLLLNKQVSQKLCLLNWKMRKVAHNTFHILNLFWGDI